MFAPGATTAAVSPPPRRQRGDDHVGHTAGHHRPGHHLTGIAFALAGIRHSIRGRRDALVAALPLVLSTSN